LSCQRAWHFLNTPLQRGVVERPRISTASAVSACTPILPILPITPIHTASHYPSHLRLSFGLRTSDFSHASRMPRRLVEIVEFPQWKLPPTYGKSSNVLAQIRQAWYRKYSKYLKYPSHSAPRVAERHPCRIDRQLSRSSRRPVAPKSDVGGGSIPLPRLGKLFPKTVPFLCQNCAKTVPKLCQNIFFQMPARQEAGPEGQISRTTHYVPVMSDMCQTRPKQRVRRRFAPKRQTMKENHAHFVCRTWLKCAIFDP
jgi:hypothetical protein